MQQLFNTMERSLSQKRSLFVVGKVAIGGGRGDSHRNWEGIVSHWRHEHSITNTFLCEKDLVRKKLHQSSRVILTDKMSWNGKSGIDGLRHRIGDPSWGLPHGPLINGVNKTNASTIDT